MCEEKKKKFLCFFFFFNLFFEKIIFDNEKMINVVTYHFHLALKDGRAVCIANEDGERQIPTMVAFSGEEEVRRESILFMGKKRLGTIDFCIKLPFFFLIN